MADYLTKLRWPLLVAALLPVLSEYWVWLPGFSIVPPNIAKQVLFWVGRPALYLVGGWIAVAAGWSITKAAFTGPVLLAVSMAVSIISYESWLAVHMVDGRQHAFSPWVTFALGLIVGGLLRFPLALGLGALGAYVCARRRRRKSSNKPLEGTEEPLHIGRRTQLTDYLSRLRWALVAAVLLPLVSVYWEELPLWLRPPASVAQPIVWLCYAGLCFLGGWIAARAGWSVTKAAFTGPVLLAMSGGVIFLLDVILIGPDLTAEGADGSHYVLSRWVMFVLARVVPFLIFLPLTLGLGGLGGYMCARTRRWGSSNKALEETAAPPRA